MNPAHDTSHDAERRTRAVALLTAATMVGEIAAGWWFNSMALLADGWHMGTHAVAIGLSAWAYAWARRCHTDPAYAFGGWKVEMLAAFASAITLLATAAVMALASMERLWMPQPIRYAEAMGVAALGLLVNLASAWMLGVHHHGHHEHTAPAGPSEPQGPGAMHKHHGLVPAAEPSLVHHGHAHHGHAHHGHAHPHAPPHACDADLNLHSAYLHVLADAATSALAIVALAGGLWLGWSWLDPLMGLVGAALIARWGLLLVRDTSRVLLDREMDHPFVASLRQALEEDPPWGTRTQVRSLRAWRVGRIEWAVMLHLTTDDPAMTAQRVRAHLQRRCPRATHLTVQIEAASVASPLRG